MRKLLYCLCLLLAFTLTTEQSSSQSIIEGGVDSFLRETRTGQLAIIPNVRNLASARELNSVVLLDNSTVRIDRSMASQGLLWFAINHYTADEGEDLAPTHVAVKIIAIYDTPTDSVSDIYLYRNSNWFRERLRRGFNKGSVGRNFHTKSVQNFMSAHAEVDRVEEFDELLDGFRYHGTPAGSEISSWSHRTFWHSDFGELSECTPEADNCKIKSYLLRFTPTSSPRSFRPLIFYSNIYNMSGIYIRVFSPIDERYNYSGKIIFE